MNWVFATIHLSINRTSPPFYPFYWNPQISSPQKCSKAKRVGIRVWFWSCFRPAFSSCYQLTSVCVCVCVPCRIWQEEFVLLSGSLKSSSSLDSKPGLMTRLILWHLCTALSLSEPHDTHTAQPNTRSARPPARDLPAAPHECVSRAHAGVLQVLCEWGWLWFVGVVDSVHRFGAEHWDD